jgi:YegS/Rv2252/BmrU family lipid kinase
LSKSVNQWFFIVNPAGGNWEVQRRWPELEAQLRASGLDFELEFSQQRGHPIEIAEQAIGRGFRQIAAVGGDGTCHEVVNGIMRQSAVPSAEVKFALLPVGTGNDWVRTWQIPEPGEDWIRMLRHGKTALQDVGVVDFLAENGKPSRRYFINVAGLAYDAYVARRAIARGKHPFTRFLYLWLVFRCLFEYRLTRSRLEFGDQSLEDFFYTINVGICKYSGGGMQLVPHALPDDGLLALTYARRMTKLQVILNTWRFYDGSLPEHPAVFTYSVESVKVEGLDGTQLWVEADGEYLGGTPAGFSIEQRALCLVVV